jgi:hypothetical protein
MDINTLAGVAVAVVSVLGVVAVAWRAWRKFHKSFGRFMEDWNGEPARPGVPAKPGVMVRLASIEKEIHPNSGSSLRDAINRIEARVDGLEPHALHQKETA